MMGNYFKIMTHTPIRRLNFTDHTMYHEQLSEVLMNILNNGQWMEMPMVKEIQKLSSMSAGRRARAQSPNMYETYAYDELNKALMDIWVEQERSVPTQEFIDNLKQYIL